MSGILADHVGLGRQPAQVNWTPAFVGLLVYVFVIMTYRLPIGTVVMAGALVSLLLQRQSLRMPPFLWLFAAWTAWAVVGYLTTPYPDVVRESLIERGKLLLVTLVAINALRTGTQVRYFMLFTLASYILFPARSTLVNYVTGNTLLGRAVGPFIYENPNDLAAVTILMLGPAVALWAESARGTPIAWIGLAGAAPLIVITARSQSPGAFLAAASMGWSSAVPQLRALTRG